MLSNYDNSLQISISGRTINFSVLFWVIWTECGNSNKAQHACICLKVQFKEKKSLYNLL